MLGETTQLVTAARDDHSQLKWYGLRPRQLYLQWMSPIGMSPREVAKTYELHGITFTPGERVFLMFGSGNRDESVFAKPDVFDITQDCGPSIAFGAGPHFCAGAWAARCLIAVVALPRRPGVQATPRKRPYGSLSFV